LSESQEHTRRALNKIIQYLPIIIFAICVVIAILLTVMAPSLWPAALAIAISGAALALAFRSQDNREIGYLTDDITVLQEQNAVLKEQADELRTEVATNHEMIDELADIVEQIATLTADGGEITRAEVDALRDEMTDIRLASPTVGQAPQGQSDQIEIRLAALEARNTSATAAEFADASLGLTTAAAATAATTATAATATDVGNLRSLMARSNGEAEAQGSVKEPEIPAATISDASLAPVFQPDLGAPVAFILRPTSSDTPLAFSAMLQHATQVSTELEEAQRENLLFVRLSSKTLEETSVRDSILSAVAEHPPLQRRLAILTDQKEFSDASLQTLTAIAAEGCRFGLDNVRDWSINLASLARAGMAFILVDGPAMARSAQDQGGDPRRLAQALGMHEIALIAGGVTSKEDIDAVSGLEPTFLTGEGLGEARELEAAS